MINNNTIALPDRAQLKLADLELQTNAALDAGHAAASRIGRLAQDDQRTRAGLAIERDRHQARHRALAALLSRVNQFLMELRGVTLELVPPPAIEHDIDLNDAIGGVRAEIAMLRGKLANVKAAPLPPADMKVLAEERVVSLMRAGRVGVAVQGDALKLGFRGDMLSGEDVLALLAFIAPDAVLRGLEREIDAMPVHAGAMPKAERLKRVAELEALTFQLELYESALLERADNTLPRPDMDPRAFLGVTVAAQVQQVA